MPPAPRDSAPGIHHVWVNATGNWAYYLDEIDRLVWIRLFVRTLDRYGWTCIAFCQMTTHVHFVVEVGDESLPDGMRYLNREYSKDFNARHDRVGFLVRKRYGNRRIGRGSELVVAYAYVVLNPVKAKLCVHAKDWRWSSHPTTVGLNADFPFIDASLVLAEFGSSRDTALAGLSGVIEAQEIAAWNRPGHVP